NRHRRRPSGRLPRLRRFSRSLVAGQVGGTPAGAVRPDERGIGPPVVDAAVHLADDGTVGSAQLRALVQQLGGADAIRVQAVLVWIEEQIGQLDGPITGAGLEVELEAARVTHAATGAPERAGRTILARGAPDARIVATPARVLLDAGVVASRKELTAVGILDARRRRAALVAETGRADRTLRAG